MSPAHHNTCDVLHETQVAVLTVVYALSVRAVVDVEMVGIGGTVGLGARVRRAVR